MLVGRKATSGAYHQLGTLAQDQQQYDQAETNYRKTLDIHRESDQGAASNRATRLGAVLAAPGQHREATRTFLYAAFTWHQETRQWAKEGLRWLRRERGVLGQEEFTGLVKRAA